MPALQVRDLPQDVYDDLKAQAEQEHRSMSQQTIVLLQQALQAGKQSAQQQVGARRVSYEDSLAGWRYPPDETREERIERRKRLFAQIDAMPKIELPDDFPTSEQIVREMRIPDDCARLQRSSRNSSRDE